MKKSFFNIFLIIFFIPSCTISEQKKDHTENENYLINLVESTHIIRELIRKNQLNKILGEHNPEQLAILIDNFSPAKMTLETEVLSTTMPLVVVYYFNKNSESKDFIKKLKNLSAKYDDQVKFVIVDSERLFSLIKEAKIEKIPTVLFVKNREIIDNLDENINLELIEKKIQKYQEKLVKY
jgi:thioredoxin-like negative regulator of GroEL